MKFRTAYPPVALALALSLLAGCGQKSGDQAGATASTAGSQASAKVEGEGMPVLQQSMDRYHGLNSLSATCDWTMNAGSGAGNAAESQRSIAFQAPNKFRLSAKHKAGLLQEAVSDGKNLIEWTNAQPDSKAVKYKAPRSLDQASTPLLKHPMFCGTMLLQFFAGKSAAASLVNLDKGPVTLASAPAREGEEVAKISFYAQGEFGNTTMVIGKKSGKVFEIDYDADPLVQQMKASNDPRVNSITGMHVSEKYSQVVFDKPIDSSRLAAKLPAGTKSVVAAVPGEEPTPPEVGTQAPDFSVSPVLGGKPVKLADLKGHYVLLDFWATWCGPCKETLPHTSAIAKDFRDKGLVTLAISAEKPDKIKAFWADHDYSMPAYQDNDGAASEAYGAAAIPLLVLIDPTGKIAYAKFGSMPEADLRANLADAGLK